MTPFDGELEHVCAWGRWRIGTARNEPVLDAEREVDRVPARPARLVVPGALRGRARLRLVVTPGAGVRR